MIAAQGESVQDQIRRLFFRKMLSCSLQVGGCSPLFILWVFLLLPLASLHQQEQHGDPSSRERPKLLLVSFDGFRWDYIIQVPMPNFNAVARDGVMVEQVENTYITKTFPNHYSLVTGLYAETHGIVANEMYDPALNRSFSMETDSIYEPQWWEEAEPLWVTIQRTGGRSGAAMWPGSDVKIHGVFPNRYLRYNASVSFESRVERIIEWFSAPGGESVNFAVLYWEEPDESGHKLGPQNPEMDRVITEIDGNLGFLVSELKKAGLYENMNLIVTSDHGMTQLPDEHIIELDQYVDRDLYTWVDKSPVVGILPKEGKFDEVYKNLLDANPNMAVYKREDIPAHFHYRHNTRIMPILLEAKEGWTIVQNRTGQSMLGNHGYNNTLSSMQPLFLARGPAFRQRYTKASMRSIDLYPLLCHILAVPPLPNNGSLSNVQDLLAQQPTQAPSPSVAPKHEEKSSAAVVGTLLGVVLVLGFLVFFVRQVTLKQLPSLRHSSREMSQPLLHDP